MQSTETTPGLRFIPLGGVGEIGMNTALYGVDGRWLMVDLGISFADETLPGVDIVLPDVGFAERLPEIEGLVITHAHEDHYGGVPYLWPRLRCPIWCTPFVAAALARKLDDVPFGREVPINVVEPGEPFRVGSFDLSFIHVTHSVPDANALVLRTEYGNVLHTGDSIRSRWSGTRPRSTNSRRSVGTACSRCWATAPTCCGQGTAARKRRSATA
jgi:ribonuclease J